jgi:hypothetical protein
MANAEITHANVAAERARKRTSPEAWLPDQYAELTSNSPSRKPERGAAPIVR